MPSNYEWFFIEAKNHSYRGYVPASSKEEACRKLGVIMEESITKRVIWDGKVFVDVDQFKQGRLFL